MDESATPPNNGPLGQRVRNRQPRIPLGVSVLIAEHDEDKRRVMALALAKEGYTHHQVTDGGAALEYLPRARPPLVVVAEEGLPEIGGFQLAGLLALKRGAECRYNVVVLTDDLRTALRQSLNRKLDSVTLEVLVQPFHVNELLLAVEMAAERLAGRAPSSSRGLSDLDAHDTSRCS